MKNSKEAQVIPEASPGHFCPFREVSGLDERSSFGYSLWSTKMAKVSSGDRKMKFVELSISIFDLRLWTSTFGFDLWLRLLTFDFMCRRDQKLGY